MIEMDKENLINLILMAIKHLRADGDTSHYLSFLAFTLPPLLQTGCLRLETNSQHKFDVYFERLQYKRAYIVPYKAKKLICICIILKQNLSLTKVALNI